MDRLQRRIPPIALSLVGLTVAGIGFGYRVGGLTDMGPGFLPVALGIGLSVVGGVILLTDRVEEPQPDTESFRPLLAVSAGLLAWVLLAESAGFVPATVAQLLLTSLALKGARWKALIVMVAALGLTGYIIFVVQLGVPLRAFAF